MGLEKFSNSEEKTYPTIPTYVFDQIFSDLESLPENNDALEYNKGQELELAINSEKSARYQVAEAKKGHYLMVRNEPITAGTQSTTGEAFLSYEEKTSENPDLFVCTPEELEAWIKK